MARCDRTLGRNSQASLGTDGRDAIAGTPATVYVLGALDGLGHCCLWGKRRADASVGLQSAICNDALKKPLLFPGGTPCYSMEMGVGSMLANGSAISIL